MKFWEAMKALEHGKRIVRKGWEPNCSEPWQWKNISIGDIHENDWIALDQEPERTLSFSEVVAGLKEGKRFKRKNAPVSVVLSQDRRTICHCIQGRMELDLKDFEATDWIEVKE